MYAVLLRVVTCAIILLVVMDVLVIVIFAMGLHVIGFAIDRLMAAHLNRWFSEIIADHFDVIIIMISYL